MTATLVDALAVPTGTTVVTGIRVTTAAGTSDALTFTLTPPLPDLASITPATGVQGNFMAVTISGKNLTGATFNVIAGITLTGVTDTANSITATFGLDPAAVGARSAQRLGDHRFRRRQRADLHHQIRPPRC
jgi:hypothetical protein